MPTATAGRVSTRARCFATAPSLEEVSAAPATSVPSPEEVAELWEEHKPAKKFTRFNKDDPLNLESLLTEEEVMVKDSVHDFCQDNLVPRVQDGFRNEEFDRTMFPEMGAMGMLGATIQGYGCPGLSSTAYGLISREVERVDSGYRSAMSVQSSLVMGPIYEHEIGRASCRERV